MPSIADLFVSVSADVSGAISGLTGVDNQVRSTSSAMEDATPAAIALGVAAGAVGAGFATSIHAASDFETQINGIRAVMSPTEVQTYGAAVEQLALTLGRDTVFSASQAAQGIAELIRAGVPLPAVLGGAAASALDLAAATGVSITQAATLASTAMNTYHLSAAQLPAIMDEISNVSNATAIDVGQLQFALASVGPVATGVGLSFQDTATALGIFANNGLVGSDAGTSLRTMLLNLQPSTQAQTEAFRALGLITADGSNQFFDATGRARSMSEIFQVLQNSTSGLTAEQRTNLLQTAFGTDAVRAATIAAGEGAAGWDAVRAAMDRMGGTQISAAQRMAGITGALSQLSGSFETVQITIGQFFLPTLVRVVDLMTSVLNAFISLDPAMQLTIVTVAGLVGAVAGLLSAWVLVGPTVLSTVESFGSLLIAVAPLLPILVGLGAAAAALYQAWQTNFGGIQGLTSTVWQAVQVFLGSFSHALDVLGQAMLALRSGDFAGFLTGIQAAAQDFANAFGPAFANLLPVVLGALGQLATALAQWITTTGLPQLGAWAQAFIDWIGPMIPGLLAALGDIATAVLDWVATVGVPNLLAWGQAFLDWVGPLIPPLLAELGTILSAIAGWIAAALPVLIQYALQLGNAFLGWITPLIPQLLTALGGILVAIAGWIIGTAVPAIAQAALQLGNALITWVAPLIPPLLLELGTILVAIANWIIGTALPLLTQYALRFGTAFLGWVAPILPQLLLELAQIVVTIASWVINTALPLLTQVALQFGTAFLGWVTPMIPQLLLQFAQISLTIASWIIGTALPLLTQAALQFGTAFLTWIAPTIPPLLLQLGDILATIAGWIIGTALPLIRNQVFQWGLVFIDWIGATVPPLLAELGNFLLVLANWIIGVALPEIAGLTLQWVGPFLSWITGTLIPQIGPALRNLLTVIGDLLAGLPSIIISVLGDPWAPFVNATFGVGARIGTAILSLIDLIGQNLGQILGVIRDAVTPVLALFLTIAAAADALYAAWQNNFLGIRDVTQQVWDAIQPGLQNIANFAQLIGQTLGAAFQALYNAASPLITQFGQALAPILAQLPGAIRALGDAFNAIAPYVATIGQVLNFLVTGNLDQLYALMQQGLPQPFAAGLQLLRDIIVVTLDVVGRLLGGIRDFVGYLLAGNVQGAFDSLVNTFRGIADQVLPLWNEFLLVVGNAVRALAPFIAERIGDLWSAIRDEFGALPSQLAPYWDNFLGWLGGVLSGLPGFVGTAMGDIWGGLTAAFDALIPQLQPYWDNFASWFGSVLGGIPQFVVDRMGDIWGGLVAVFGGLIGVLAPLWDQFAGWLSSVLGGLPQFIIDHVRHLRRHRAAGYRPVRAPRRCLRSHDPAGRDVYAGRRRRWRGASCWRGRYDGGYWSELHLK